MIFILEKKLRIVGRDLLYLLSGSFRRSFRYSFLGPPFSLKTMYTQRSLAQHNQSMI